MNATIHFTDARNERALLRDKYDLLLGIVATLQIWVDGKLLYREEVFPVVELRAALERWLAVGLPARRDFEFQSMESDEEALIWLRSVGSTWRIGSIHQEFPAMNELDDKTVIALTRTFIEEVDQWVLEHCDVRVSSFL